MGKALFQTLFWNYMPIIFCYCAIQTVVGQLYSYSERWTCGASELDQGAMEDMDFHVSVHLSPGENVPAGCTVERGQDGGGSVRLWVMLLGARAVDVASHMPAERSPLYSAAAVKMTTLFWTGTKKSCGWWSTNTWSGCWRPDSLLTIIFNFLTAAVK